MVKLNVDYDRRPSAGLSKPATCLASTPKVKRSNSCAVNCRRSSVTWSRAIKSKMAGTCYCSFCGKSQHEVPKLIAGPAVFICDECVGLCSEIVEEKRDNPDPATKQAREIKLEELKQLRADVARLHEGLARIEEKINGMVEET